MIRFLLVLSLCVVLQGSAVAQDIQPAHTIIFLGPDTASDHADQVRKWITADPVFAALRARTNYMEFTPKNALYLERYQAAIPPSPLPVVVCHDHRGGVWYKASGSAIPSSPKALLDAMGDAYKAYQKLPATAQPQPVIRDLGVCPTCPKQPPATPSTPAQRRPVVDRVLDGLVPDTVNVSPTVQISDTAVIAAVAGSVILMIAVGGVFLAILAVTALYFLNR